MIEEYECLPTRDKVSGDERHCIWYEREMLDGGSTILTESVIAIQREGSDKLIERLEGKHGINSVCSAATSSKQATPCRWDSQMDWLVRFI